MRLFGHVYQQVGVKGGAVEGFRLFLRRHQRGCGRQGASGFSARIIERNVAAVPDRKLPLCKEDLHQQIGAASGRNAQILIPAGQHDQEADVSVAVDADAQHVFGSDPRRKADLQPDHDGHAAGAGIQFQIVEAGPAVVLPAHAHFHAQHASRRYGQRQTCAEEKGADLRGHLHTKGGGHAQHGLPPDGALPVAVLEVASLKDEEEPGLRRKATQELKPFAFLPLPYGLRLGKLLGEVALFFHFALALFQVGLVLCFPQRGIVCTRDILHGDAHGKIGAAVQIDADLRNVLGGQVEANGGPCQKAGQA